VKLTTTSTQGVDKENYLLPFTAYIKALDLQTLFAVEDERFKGLIHMREKKY